MPPIVKRALTFVLAVIGAIAIFFAGAYSSVYFTNRVLTPRLGLQNLAELVTDSALLSALDAGNVETARALLIMDEDGHLIGLDGLAPNLDDDLAKSTCKIMRGVAKRRTDNAAKYAATEPASDPDVRKLVTASLQNPVACARAK